MTFVNASSFLIRNFVLHEFFDYVFCLFWFSTWDVYGIFIYLRQLTDFLTSLKRSDLGSQSTDEKLVGFPNVSTSLPTLPNFRSFLSRSLSESSRIKFKYLLFASLFDSSSSSRGSHYHLKSLRRVGFLLKKWPCLYYDEITMCKSWITQFVTWFLCLYLFYVRDGCVIFLFWSILSSFAYIMCHSHIVHMLSFMSLSEGESERLDFTVTVGRVEVVVTEGWRDSVCGLEYYTRYSRSTRLRTVEGVVVDERRSLGDIRKKSRRLDSKGDRCPGNVCDERVDIVSRDKQSFPVK